MQSINFGILNYQSSASQFKTLYCKPSRSICSAYLTGKIKGNGNFAGCCNQIPKQN